MDIYHTTWRYIGSYDTFGLLLVPLTLKVETVNSSETSVHLYQTTQPYIPEDSTCQDLFYIFPAGHYKLLPRKPAYGFMGHHHIKVEMYVKVNIFILCLCVGPIKQCFGSCISYMV